MTITAKIGSSSKSWRNKIIMTKKAKAPSIMIAIIYNKKKRGIEKFHHNHDPARLAAANKLNVILKSVYSIRFVKQK